MNTTRIKTFFLYSLAGAAILASNPGGGPPHRVDAEFVGRGAEAFELLYTRQAVDGGEMLVPLPPGAVLERLAGAREPWKKALRAETLEKMGRLDEAEVAWRDFAGDGVSQVEGASALADFYRRHHMKEKEMDVLLAVVAGIRPDDKAKPTPVDIWTRILGVADERGIEGVDRAPLLKKRADYFRGFPGEAEYLSSWVESMCTFDSADAAKAALTQYRERFPEDIDTPFALDVRLLGLQGSPDDLLRFVDASFMPTLKPETVKGAFEELEKEKVWTAFLAKAEGRLRRDPADADAAWRLFHARYYRDNIEKAGLVLRDLRLLKNSRLAGGGAAAGAGWTPAQLAVMAVLSARCGDYDETMRYASALERESKPGMKLEFPGLKMDDVRREALTAAFRVLTEKRESASYARVSMDGWSTLIKADDSPGIAGGALSVLLGGQGSIAALFDKLASGDELGAYERVRRAEQILKALEPLVSGEEYLDLRMGLADGYARFGGSAAAGRVLEETGRKSSDPGLKRKAYLLAARMAEEAKSLGDAERLLSAAAEVEGKSLVRPVSMKALEFWAPDGAAAADRWAGLDALTAFYARQGRPLDAFRAYQKAMERSPQEESLYEKLAGFLEEHGMDQYSEDYYKRAASQFDKAGWTNRLARLYLRQQRTAEFQAMCRRVVDTLEGTPLHEYLTGILPQVQEALGAKGYRLFALEIYQAALNRFPVNRAILDQVLSLSSDVDPGRNRQLLAAYAMLFDHVRDRYFQGLAARGSLEAVLSAAAPSDQDPGLLWLKAEGLAWRCRFEDARPLFERLAALYPDREAFVSRCASLLQSDGTRDPGGYAKAAALLKAFGRASGREDDFYIRAGDCLAFGGRATEAEGLWRDVLRLYPRDRDKWLEVATVFWDYYRYEDALALIGDIRKRLGRDDLFAFESAALLESLGRVDEALAEYLPAAVVWQDRSWDAQSRLDRLFKADIRNRERFVRMVAAALEESYEPATYLANVRQFLENWNMADKFPVKEWVLGILGRSKDSDTVRRALDSFSGLIGSEDRLRAYRRLVEMAPPGVNRLEAVFRLAGALKESGKSSEGVSVVLRLHSENPLNLGVVRKSCAFLKDAGEVERLMAVCRDAISRSSEAYRREFTMALAEAALGVAQYSQAAAAADSWLKDHPDDGPFTAVKWQAMAGMGDQAGLLREYAAALDRVQKTVASPEERKACAVAVRGAAVASAMKLGDKTLALDHLVETMKLEPEDKGLLERAYALASGAGLTDRLEVFLRKFMDSSPSDYRWPLLLARLAMLKEDFPSAIELYGLCLKIAPERTDLAEESARPLEVTGDLERLQALYAELSRLRPDLPGYLKDAGDVARRRGRDAEAAGFLRQYAGAASESAVDRALLAFDVCRGWRWYGQALDSALSLFKTWPLSPSLLAGVRGKDILGTALRAGRLREALNRLLDLYGRALSAAAGVGERVSEEDETPDGEAKARLSHLSYILRTNLSGLFQEPQPAEVREAVAAALEPRLAVWLAGKAGDSAAETFEAPAEKALLPGVLKALYAARVRAEGGDSLPWDIKEYLESRGLWGELRSLYGILLANAGLMEADRLNVLNHQAYLATLSGKVEEELVALRTAYRMAEVPRETALKYFDALERAGRLAELGPGASLATRHRSALVELLASRKKFALASQVLQNESVELDGTLVQANQALLAAASGGKLPADTHFRSVLGVADVGSLLSEQGEGDALSPPKWHEFATRYGEFLLSSPGRREEAEAFLPAELERNLRRRQDYDDLFRRVLNAGDPSLARRVLGFGRSLQKSAYLDAVAELDLALKGKVAAEVAAAYQVVLERAAEAQSGQRLAADGHRLLSVGREYGLLEKTSSAWLAAMRKAGFGSDEGADIAGLFRLYAYCLPAGKARADWLWAWVRGSDDPVAAAKDLYRKGFAPDLPTGALARFVAEKSEGDEEDDRGARLAALGERFGAGRLSPASDGLPIAGTRKGADAEETGETGDEADTGESGEGVRGGFLATPGLSEAVGGFSVSEWRSFYALLQSKAAAGDALTAENAESWCGGLPGGREGWEDVFGLLSLEWGKPQEAWKIRVQRLNRETLARVLTEDERFELGVLCLRLGRQEATAHFRSALDRAADRPAMAAKVVRELLERDRAGDCVPFLGVLKLGDPLGPEAAELSALVAWRINPAGLQAKEVRDACLRPDLSWESRNRLLGVVRERLSKDRALAASFAASGVFLQIAGPWREAAAVLDACARQGAGDLGGAWLALAPSFQAHGDARLLAAHFLDEAAKAGRADVAEKCFPAYLRGRDGGDRGMVPLFRAALAAKRERTALALVWFDAMQDWSSLNQADTSFLENLGQTLAEKLVAEKPDAEGFKVVAELLGRMSCPGAMAWLGPRAIEWDLDSGLKEKLAASAVSLREEVRKAGLEADGRYRFVESVEE